MFLCSRTNACVRRSYGGCHPSLPFICAHNRDEQRDRPSRDDSLEEDTQLLCGRDIQAGGTVLGLHAVGGGFAALTNCRTTVKYECQYLHPTTRRSGQLTARPFLETFLHMAARRLVEFLAVNGTAGAEEFICSRKIDPFHALAGHIFCDSPEIHYFWSAPPDTGEQESSRWSAGHRILERGVFVVSNENPAGEAWPKCFWLRRAVEDFLEQLKTGDKASDASELVGQVHAGLAEIMSRSDVPELKDPAMSLPKWFPEAVEDENVDQRIAPKHDSCSNRLTAELRSFLEEKLHSGPFCPWRPDLQTFGTVSQRILVCDGIRRQTHYYYRPTNLGSPPQLGPWRSFLVRWPLLVQTPSVQQSAKLWRKLLHATSDQGRQGARRRSAEIVEVNEALDQERLLRSSLLATAALAVFRGLGGAAGASSRSELLQTLTSRLAPLGSPARATLRSWLRRLRLCRAREVVLPDDRRASTEKVSGTSEQSCSDMMEAPSFVLLGTSPVAPVVPATSAPGLPRRSTGRWQGVAGPCMAATAAALAAAATRRTRCARVVRSALSDNPWDYVNKRTRTKGNTQGGAPWFAPGWGDEEDEDEAEEELERKKPVEESVYCCWVMPKKKAAEFLKAGPHPRRVGR
eukprot:s4225_g8.t1